MPPASMTTAALLERLVAFDTTSERSNLALIDFVEAYLAEHGVASRRSSRQDGKANLFATLGPQRDGGVVLSGHSDVVPVAGQDWSSDPFALARRDGRLYGRGSCDMKGFLAAALALVPEALAAGLERPLHLAISYDEEVGCFGAEALIADIGRSGLRPAAVIVGEPTEMRLISGHKGIAVYRTEVRGLEAHSSEPHRGASAIFAAARLIGFLEELARARREGPPDEAYDPPYSTFNVGMVEGGTAHNIVPRHCAFTWQVRLLPSEDGTAILDAFERYAEEQVLPGLRATAPEAVIATHCLAAVPGLAAEPDSAAEGLVRLLTGLNSSEQVSFATEAGLFQRAGIPTVVCGPGSIRQAHRPDEFIEIAQLEACDAFLRRLIAWCAGGTGL